MRIVVRRIAARMAVGAIGCLACAVLPVLASGLTADLANGASITVWEERGRAVRGRDSQVWSINYSMTDATGRRLGVVVPTEDAARDSAPFLALDGAGSAVLVWSRFDGSYRKIAYARFADGAWINFHYLTFGPGNDDQPRIGSARAGAFLFFASESGNYQYAPFDLTTGRLFAVPRLIDLGSARRDVLPPAGATTQGGTVDIPVVNRCGGERQGCAGQSIASRSRLLPPGGPTTQGGTVDIPVVNRQASVWGVGSSGDCSSLVLVIPTHDLKSAVALRFFNGLTDVLQRVSLPSQLEDRFGESLTASYLPLVCN